MSRRIDRLPRNDHGHHGGFAGTCRKFQRQSRQLRFGVLIGCGEVVEKPLAVPGTGFLTVLVSSAPWSLPS
jgi:hypothetical protein